MKPPPFKDVNVLEIVLEILFMNPLIFKFFYLFFIYFIYLFIFFGTS